MIAIQNSSNIVTQQITNESTASGVVHSQFSSVLETMSSSLEEPKNASRLGESWLTNNPIRSEKPSVSKFKAATDTDTATAIKILYGSIGANEDLRDWDKIMSSNNPLKFAREATKQLYNSDLSYELKHSTNYGKSNFNKTLEEHNIESQSVVAQNGNFAIIEPSSGNREAILISKSGLMLAGAGENKEAIEANTWVYGFDFSEFEDISHYL